MEKFTFSANLINAILQYLDTRPHSEVRRLIDAIQQQASSQQIPPAVMDSASTPETKPE